MWRWATMWSPLEHSAMTTVATAPMPDAKARPASAPFELGDGLLERGHRRVGVAAVEALGPRRGGHGAVLLQAVDLPHRAGVQHRAERAGRRGSGRS